ncbi:hypothetical protein [Bdellovibrio bacteriovorus]|uniref:Uncharacterized protein n=1 Tax=Bdellovibrio bacteriovorus str. Tiberius TaxID=1069642 RepID=K7YUY6_BDEBC|nr:hypothetical protein [Bdellovibrio bacteriovorus]AFY01453.1 hypothetical protein Bdt_1763 [Bdellovibrio bacteriovorus str. Tiberius]
MLKRTLCFILALSLGLPVKAPAAALRCESVFIPSLKEVLQTIDRENSQYLFNGKSVQEHTSTLSWNRKRKIRKILNQLEIENVPSQVTLERQAVELGTLMFGAKDAPSRWIKKNGQERLEESAVLIVKEQLLKEGLIKTWGQTHDAATLSALSKVMDRVWRFQHSRIMEFAGIPYWLPKMPNKAISKELMFKVIRDGYAAHQKEVTIALKSQNYRDAYNTFAKIYKPVVFALIFIFIIERSYDQYQDEINNAVDTMIKDLQQQRESLDKALPQVKLEEGKNAFRQALEGFKMKWGEEPTPAERAVMQTRIESALGLPQGSIGE